MCTALLLPYQMCQYLIFLTVLQGYLLECLSVHLTNLPSSTYTISILKVHIKYISHQRPLVKDLGCFLSGFTSNLYSLKKISLSSSTWCMEFLPRLTNNVYNINICVYISIVIGSYSFIRKSSFGKIIDQWLLACYKFGSISFSESLCHFILHVFSQVLCLYF